MSSNSNQDNHDSLSSNNVSPEEVTVIQAVEVEQGIAPVAAVEQTMSQLDEPQNVFVDPRTYGYLARGAAERERRNRMSLFLEDDEIIGIAPVAAVEQTVSQLDEPQNVFGDPRTNSYIDRIVAERERRNRMREPLFNGQTTSNTRNERLTIGGLRRFSNYPEMQQLSSSEISDYDDLERQNVFGDRQRDGYRTRRNAERAVRTMHREQYTRPRSLALPTGQSTSNNRYGSFWPLPHQDLEELGRAGRQADVLRAFEQSMRTRSDAIGSSRSNTVVNTASQLTSDPLAAELAVSKEMVDSFGPNGLIEDQEEDVTDIEEMIFKKVLKKKMVCDICLTHMKIYRCFQCMYSMCQECSKKIQRDHDLKFICPHCREKQESFELIKLPRF